jgi:GNAT superfamily N-acetyltransferase
MDSVTVLGWHPSVTGEDGPRLRLDWRRFSYAGKFVMTNTGKAVVREGSDDPEAEFDESVLAAVAFNEDRTDDGALWLRYVTVRDDLRGHGLGPRLCDSVATLALGRGYDCVRIAVNNPFAYDALYKAGFGFTGRETGIAELVLERPNDREPARYRRGIDRFRDRELSATERRFVDGRTEPPSRVPSEGEFPGRDPSGR